MTNNTPSDGEKQYPRYAGPRVATILMDPPWDVLQKGGYGADHHYDVLSLDQIKRLPIDEIATDDAHLWMWVTNGTLRAGYDFIEAWGFTPRTGPITWVKPRLGLGQYLRNATKHLLFATRGKSPVHFKAQPTWLFAPLQDHSHKPEEQFAIIERVSGPGPKLELFARRRPPVVDGSPWLVWGNEVDSDISIPGFPVPSDFDDQKEAA